MRSFLLITGAILVGFGCVQVQDLGGGALSDSGGPCHANGDVCAAFTECCSQNCVKGFCGADGTNGEGGVGGAAISSSSSAAISSSSSAAPTCQDGLNNGTETDLDCGGRGCPPCGDGKQCLVHEDCTSSVCESDVCQPEACDDGVQNGAETDLDCGGSGCAACLETGRCALPSDCQSGVCLTGVCRAATCVDGLKNGTESDKDCGGTCPGCALGQACVSNTDCLSAACTGSVCVIHSAVAGAWEPTPDSLTSHLSSIALGYSIGAGGINGNWSGFALAGFDNGELYRTSLGHDAVPAWVRRIDKWNDASGGTHQLPAKLITSIAVNPCNFRDVWVGYAGGKQSIGLTHSANGFTWVDATSFPFFEVWGISISPMNACGRIYVTGPGGVAQSVDGGVTWTTSTPAAGDPLAVPLDSEEQVSAVAIVGHNPDHLLVGTLHGKLYESSNASADPASWKTIGPFAMPARTVTHITVDPSLGKETIVYVAYGGGNNDSLWRLWRRENGSETWINIHNDPLMTTSIPVLGVYAFTGVSVNPADPSALYLPSVGSYGTAWGHSAVDTVLWSLFHN